MQREKEKRRIYVACRAPQKLDARQKDVMLMSSPGVKKFGDQAPDAGYIAGFFCACSVRESRF